MMLLFSQIIILWYRSIYYTVYTSNVRHMEWSTYYKNRSKSIYYVLFIRPIIIIKLFKCSSFIQTCHNYKQNKPPQYMRYAKSYKNNCLYIENRFYIKNNSDLGLTWNILPVTWYILLPTLIFKCFCRLLAYELVRHSSTTGQCPHNLDMTVFMRLSHLRKC